MDYNDFDISDYTEPIFRFCLKNLNNRTDAEDLSQEILLHILEGMKKSEIKNPQAYVWQIARNRYAKKIEQKNKQNRREIYNGGLLYLIADNNYVEDAFILHEEYQSVFNAVHTLSASYRDILVDYYMGEMSVKEISEKYNLTQEAVRWRLYVAKEKVKERVDIMNTQKVYEKMDWAVVCHGSFDHDKYLHNQIYRTIAENCYEKPIDIEEISLKTGIPTLYLEESLEFMIDGDAIEQIGNKYVTNFIILHADENKRMQKSIIEKTANDLTSKLWGIFEKALPEIKDNLTYGKDFPAEKLGYIFIPLLVHILHSEVCKDKDLAVGEYPKRKDGRHGWFIVRENSRYLYNSNCGCNIDFSEISGINYGIYYYWFHEVDYQLHRFFNKRSFTASYFDENGIYTNPLNDDEITAELIQHNIMSKDKGVYKSHIPVTTGGGMANIIKALTQYQSEAGINLTEYVKKVYSEYKRFVPERLYNQIIGVLYGYCSDIIPFIQDKLVKQRILREYKYDEIFTDNILFTVK